LESVRIVAGRLAGAAEAVAEAGSELAVDGPTGHDVAADAPGRLGEVGRDLYRRWLAAAADRRREAADASARLAELAETLRRAAAAYDDADHAARRRHPEES
jgi:hypothetical protein